MSEAHSTPRVRGSWSQTHGHCKGYKPTRAYLAWVNMRERCKNPKRGCFADYGGRDIRVCERWSGVGGFANFVADMGEPPEGMTLDRINNWGDYEPSNCRWTTRKTQQRNTRRNVLVTFQGRTLCLSAWSEETGIPRTALEHRLRRGWSVERMMTQPVQQKKV